MNRWDPSMFLMPYPREAVARLMTPIVKEPIDFSPLMGVANILQKQKSDQQSADQSAQEMAFKNRQLAQQGSLQLGQQNVEMRGQDMSESARKDMNARLEKQDAERTLKQLGDEYATAMSSGDEAKATVIRQAIGRAGGYTMTEHASQASPDEGAPMQNTPPPAPTGPGNGDLESGGSPTAVNPKTGASGLFQAMPDTMKAMGYTPDQWRGLSADQQKEEYWNNYLPKVKGFSPTQVSSLQAGTPAAAGENYMAIAAPSFAAKGKPDETAIYRKGTPEYDQNPAWDVNKDGTVTAGELRQLGRGGAGSSELKPRDLGDVDAPGFLGPSPRQGIMTLPEQNIGPPEPSGMGPDGLPAPKRADDGIGPETPGGGRIVFRNAEGKVIFDYDRPAIQQKEQKALAAGFQPLVDAATSPADKAAATSAFGMARGLVGNGFTPKEATDRALGVYKSAVGEAGKTARAGESDTFKIQKQMQMDADRVHQQTATQFALPSLSKDSLIVENGLKALDLGNGLGDVAAVRQWLHGVEGRASDQDYNSVLNSQGLAEWVERQLSKVDSGRLPPEFTTSLRQILTNNQRLIEQRKQMAGDTAAQAILTGSPYADDATRQQYAERARQRMLGQGAPTTPAGGGGAPSNEDLLKALGQ